ncbi:YkgJ family cysteine cluster protein [Fulvivirga maritima]|uniref:YkgJ family cysteine cluster protein n=1 Tax=Fulvivirga maritima TaxID=2904247 RepID=UPI001F1E6953|nr:YkgJ family cysteine cluster protein [Fulvivirga maritima]UII28269.1 YkgJ family cysteine cluster protein [Fulvivirga maritima]
MSIYRKVQAVERVFSNLEKELAAFKNATGLHCISGCGLCCKKPDISASPLEFLPLAYSLFKEDLAYQWLEELQASGSEPICKIFRPLLTDGDTGFCSNYKYRGLICRLFGYSAMLDKQGTPQLVTCKTIKTELPQAVLTAQQHIAEGKKTPVMRNYYFQLRSIDSELGQNLMPINQAILEALKIVLSYYAYRKPRRA